MRELTESDCTEWFKIVHEDHTTSEVPGIALGDSGLAITMSAEKSVDYVVSHVDTGTAIFCRPGVDFKVALRVCEAALKVSASWRMDDIVGSLVLNRFGRILQNLSGAEAGLLANKLADLILAVRRESNDGSEKSLDSEADAEADGAI